MNSAPFPSLLLSSWGTTPSPMFLTNLAVLWVTFLDLMSICSTSSYDLQSIWHLHWEVKWASQQTQREPVISLLLSTSPISVWHHEWPVAQAKPCDLYIYISLKILNWQCSGFMFTFFKICSKCNSYKAVCQLRFYFWYILFKIATTSSNITKKLLYYLFLIKKATHVLGTIRKAPERKWIL